MSGQRTTTGCWTCRIRRKKCDDTQPFCGPCELRQLTCHGFGPKPKWMDGAENQKAEVERIKRAVNQNFRSRRAFLTSRSTSTSRSDSRASKPPKLMACLRDISTTFPSQSSPQQLPGSAKRLGEAGPTNTIIASRKEAGTIFYPFSFHPDAPSAENEHELDLILYYLDHIFPLQYYFYQPPSLERGRSWLLSLLLRAKPSYYTALAFSCVTQILFVHRGNTTMQQKLSVDLDMYHSRALSELQAHLDVLPTISGSEHLKLGVEILATTMELLSIEVFRETKEWGGWKDDWEVHLQAAGTLLSIIGTDLRKLSNFAPLLEAEETDQRQVTTEIPSFLPLNEIAALDFFMTAYMWVDICRCASIGSCFSTSESFPYLTYLEENRVHLDSIMGCRNWAMVSIKKISNLEMWKQRMQQDRRLSIPELSRQAAEQERYLQDCLANLANYQNSLNKNEQECNLVTHLYASAALIYLGVVVSGNSHLLPELRLSVANVLKALKNVPHHLLIRVSWPYCVAGCMADESEKEEFRQLLLNAHVSGHLLGTLWNGLEIMEEFWKLREDDQFMQNSTKCAWALAMDSLGAKILLI